MVSQKVGSTPPTSTTPTTSPAGESADVASEDAPRETVGPEQSANGVNGEDHSGVGLIAAD